MIKKLMVIIAFAVILPCAVKAADDNITWSMANGVLTISGEGEMLTSPWQKRSDEITEVIIEEGITSIPKSAFLRCENIVKVSLPDSLKEIGDYAFSGCSALAELELPEGIESVGINAFTTTRIDHVRIPRSLKSGASAFRRMHSLSAFEIDDENEFFSVVDGLLYSKDKTELLCYPCGRKDEVFVVPVGTLKIGANVFYMANSFKTIILPEGLKEIGSGAFSTDYVVKNIYLPKSLEKIGDGAFSGAEMKGTDPLRLENIYYAGSRADWEKIDIGPNQTNGSLTYGVTPVSAFENVTIHYGEVSVKVNGEYLETNEYPIIENGRTYAPLDALAEALGAKSRFDYALQETVVERGITEIKFKHISDSGAPIAYVDSDWKAPVREIAEAFGASVTWDNETRSVIIEQEDRAISSGSFIYFVENGYAVIHGYSGKSSYVVIPSEIDGYSVRAIGERAFYENTEILNVFLPECVKEIRAEAFRGCHISKINLEYIEHIGSSAFTQCYYLKEVKLESLRSWDGTTESDASYGNVLNSTTPFRGCTELEKVWIKWPDDMKDETGALFLHCPNLMSVVMENAPKNHCMWEFYDMDGTYESHKMIPRNLVVSSNDYWKMTKLPESLVIYGATEDVKEYAESIGVPFEWIE